MERQVRGRLLNRDISCVEQMVYARILMSNLARAGSLRYVGGIQIGLSSCAGTQ